MALLPIDRAFVEERRPAGVSMVVEEIQQMWPSLEAYYEKGIGFGAVNGGRLVCWCSTEYLSEDRAGIGIATHPGMRRKGIAALTAATCVAECLRRGVVPFWDCKVENLPSVRLAEKLGFTLLEESDFLVWRLG